MPQDILKIIIQAAREASIPARIELYPDERNSIGSIEELNIIDADLFIKKLEEYAHEDR